MIEGAVYMSHVMRDDSYLIDVSDTIIDIIKNELEKNK